MSCTGYNCAIAGEVLIAPVLLLLHYRAAIVFLSLPCLVGMRGARPCSIAVTC